MKKVLSEIQLFYVHLSLRVVDGGYSHLLSYYSKSAVRWEKGLSYTPVMKL